MNYTLHQLQVFLKITQTKSITKAAEELHLTQPAVSIQLKNLQDQFEIPLTEVVGRQLYVTDFGKEIAIAAQNIIDEVYNINFKTLAFKGVLTGKLKISVVSTGKYVMPYFLSNFTNKNKGIELEMDVTNKLKVIKSLKSNEVDFALVSTLPSGIDINSEILLSNKLFLVANTENKALNSKKTNEYITNSPLIYREEGSATRIAMEKYIEKQGIQAKMKLQLTSNEAVKQAVIAGLGLSIMPLIGLKNELENKTIKIIPVKNLPIVTNWTLIWLKGKKLSPTAAAFLDFIQQEKANIYEKHFSWINSY
ncbi:LysR family transcriptional regulator [Flavobacterium dankookense]|uniref:DNA-binding transcriptional LysR family regulator n=1 Tax=Flavobacterium dankookense TaxID=706186 RepID=A0A4R6QF52_9FLAO|nr:LysR family transcriptional regulator [Flavobacterium dankookense]TDP61161.1 DNA-binding transcriptional LysR family regulator [Flavobacterium dankookense]